MVILFSTRLVDEDVAEIRRATPAVLRGFILRAVSDDPAGARAHHGQPSLLALP